MANDNYTPLLSMGASSYYTAEEAGAFNEQATIAESNTVTFAASCAFVITGGIQVGTIDEDSPPTSRWLWGNEDIAGKTSRGWSLTLRADINGQLQVCAAVADSAGNRVEAAVTVSGGATEGFPGFIDRVIFATLWSIASTTDGANVVMLGLNGNLCALTRSLLDNGYTPSPYAARLGADPVTGAILKSANVEFLGCNYAPVGLIGSEGDIGAAGDYAGTSWRAFYAGHGQNAFITQDFSFDWLHRYSVLSLSQGVSAAVVKTAAGEYVNNLGGAGGYAQPGSPLPDIGNKSIFPTVVAPPSPVNLLKTGTTARLLGAKNIPYYAAPAFTFPVTPPEA